MSENEKMDVMEIIQNALPGINLEAADDSPDHQIKDLKARMHAMEKTILVLKDTLEMTVNLYEQTKKESAQLQSAHQGFVGAAKEANAGLVSSLGALLEINYQTLAESVVKIGLEKGDILKEANKRVDALLQEEPYLKHVAEVVRKQIYGNIVSYLGELDEDSVRDSIIENLDFSVIAEHVEVCYDTLYEYVNFDPHDYWDASDLAYHYDASDIAEYVEASYVAEYIDADDVAASIDTEAVAQNVELDYDEVTQHIDMDTVVERLAGDDVLIGLLKDHVQITLNKEE